MVRFRSKQDNRNSRWQGNVGAEKLHLFEEHCSHTLCTAFAKFTYCELPESLTWAISKGLTFYLELPPTRANVQAISAVHPKVGQNPHAFSIQFPSHTHLSFMYTMPTQIQINHTSFLLLLTSLINTVVPSASGVAATLAARGAALFSTFSLGERHRKEKNPCDWMTR